MWINFSRGHVFNLRDHMLLKHVLDWTVLNCTKNPLGSVHIANGAFIRGKCLLLSKMLN
jgi:hypothetical protein